MKRSDCYAVLGLSLLLVGGLAWAETSAVQVGKTGLMHSTDPATQGEIREIAAASGARHALLVWQTSGHYFLGPSSRLNAALLAEDGSPGKRPLEACQDTEVREKPAIAYNDGRFLLVWQQFSRSRDWDIYGTIIEENGNVAHACGYPIANGAPNQALPAVAAAAGGFIVLWQEASAGEHNQLRTAKVDAKGMPGRSTDLLYSRTTKLGMIRYGTGWGIPASGYPRNSSDQAYVLGGTAQIAYMRGNDYLLTWVDEYGWQSNDANTRRFALLRWAGHDQPVVMHAIRSPSYSLGSSPGVLMAQEDGVLFASGSALNRNRNEVAAATILSTPNLHFRNNPNSETTGNAWQSAEIIPLFYTPVNVAAGLTAFWNETAWTVIAVGSRAGDRSLDNKLFVNSLDRRGNIAHSALEAEVLVDAGNPIGDVATFSSGGRQWLVWSQEDRDGLLTQLNIAPLSQ